MFSSAPIPGGAKQVAIYDDDGDDYDDDDVDNDEVDGDDDDDDPTLFFPCEMHNRGLIGPAPTKLKRQGAQYLEKGRHLTVTTVGDPQQRRVPATAGVEKMPKAAGYLFVSSQALL